jgi:hypothetical protein
MLKRFPIPRLLALAVALIAAAFTVLSHVDHDGRAQIGGSSSRRSTSIPTPTRAGHRTLRRAPTQVPAPAAAEVSLATSAPSVRVPPSFLGFSTEYWTLPLWEPHRALLERALALIHVPGDQRQVLRIGGDSADHTFWDPRFRRMPPWAFRVGPSWVHFAASLVRRDRLRLILDLNLVTGSSPKAASWARVARHDLPRRSIIGFEIGNEPDIYDRWSWVQQLGHPQTGMPFLPRRLSAARYLADFRAYAHALVRVAPRIPLVGPALANPQTNFNWLAGLITGAHPGLGLVSAHRYPYSACVRHTARAYPSIAKVLSDNATAGLARTVIPSVQLAERSGLPFRLTEINSVTCGGVPGISDTFATALWAPDALFELMKAGVDGANVHVRAYAFNAAFALKQSGFHARPLLYGLILFTRTIGPGARLVPLHLRTPSTHNLKAWGVRLRNGRLHVLLLDKGPRPVSVRLNLRAGGTASVERLTAPSVRAQFGVTLGGQRLDVAGRWVGARVSQQLARTRGGYTLSVPAMSADLVSLPALRARRSCTPPTDRRGPCRTSG